MKSSPGCMMPHLAAIALAVLMLSPVTIRTVMPARWHLRMASGTFHTATQCQLLLKCKLKHKLTHSAVAYLWSHRILYPNHSDAGQLCHYSCLIVPFWLWTGRQITIRNADGPQPLTCHWLNHLVIIMAAMIRKNPHLHPSAYTPFSFLYAKCKLHHIKPKAVWGLRMINSMWGSCREKDPQPTTDIRGNMWFKEEVTESCHNANWTNEMEPRCGGSSFFFSQHVFIMSQI